MRSVISLLKKIIGSKSVYIPAEIFTLEQNVVFNRSYLAYCLPPELDVPGYSPASSDYEPFPISEGTKAIFKEYLAEVLTGVVTKVPNPSNWCSVKIDNRRGVVETDYLSGV
jgi:hypothetical protein